MMTDWKVIRPPTQRRNFGAETLRQDVSQPGEKGPRVVRVANMADMQVLTVRYPPDGGRWPCDYSYKYLDDRLLDPKILGCGPVPEPEQAPVETAEKPAGEVTYGTPRITPKGYPGYQRAGNVVVPPVRTLGGAEPVVVPYIPLNERSVFHSDARGFLITVGIIAIVGIGYYFLFMREKKAKRPISSKLSKKARKDLKDLKKKLGPYPGVPMGESIDELAED